MGGKLSWLPQGVSLNRYIESGSEREAHREERKKLKEQEM